MTSTKIIGAFCGALLIFMLGKWAADSLYSMGGGHGGEEHAAYVIEVEGGDSHGEAPKEEGPDFATLMASADVDKGAKVFTKCKACHKLEAGANATGPSLHGVVGRAVDTEAGFSYSGALEAVATTWDPETLFHFLENPKGFAPGTKMSFAGLSKPEDRANLIAYLETIK
jgi:cytochrome c